MSRVHERRPVILVAGDGHNTHEPRSTAIGEWIAANDWHLLTGGGAGTMLAVSRGFHEFQRHSLAIGVIPGYVDVSQAPKTYRPKSPNYPNSSVDLAIFTHLPGHDPEGELSRNHINVLTADLVIALPGGAGTAAEVRLARQYGKPVIIYLSDGEKIADCSQDDLLRYGCVAVTSFRELVDTARSILVPELEFRRRTFSIPLSHCTLRLWQWSDLESLQRHANNKKVARNLLDQFPSPYTVRDAERWLAGSQSAGNIFAIDVSGNAVGGVGYSKRDDGPFFIADVGYWLGEEYWGRGIASEALCAVTSYAFASDPELHRLVAHVFPWNAASMRVLEKAGYQREGVLRQSTLKDGRFVDEVLFARVRE